MGILDKSQQSRPTMGILDKSQQSRQNSYNPKGLHIDRHGKLLDKYGREMHVDWNDFKNRRKDRWNPVNAAVRLGEALVASLLEADGPAKEFFKHLGKISTLNGLNWTDWDDLDEWQQKAAMELAKEVDATLDPVDNHPSVFDTDLELDSYGPADMKISLGRQEWLVYMDSDAAVTAAENQVRQDLENDPELFQQDWLENFINKDQLRRDLRPDVDNMATENFHDQHPSYEDKRDFLIDNDVLEREDFWTEQADEDGDMQEVELPIEGDLEAKIDRAVEDWVEADVENQLRDPIQYFKDIYGDEDGLKQAIGMAGIDTAHAAEAAVHEDGAAHFLARHDGDENELPCGAVYYRTG